eukprot:TRINITY_DN20823_c0_g1_i1.p1 TRINITY_DN20823_c0_g1~~TRINITY_DN20823_c0_g1_i1.p1  ORF type:complete len:479 (+),score=99.89 TRINITY_DN20823_c0_g1_i1:266-1702(+)
MLELWRGHTRVGCHKPASIGVVYDNAEFGRPAFSSDGSKLVMVVEASDKKFRGFWDQASSAETDSNKQPAADKFGYQQDFGEKLVGKVAPQLAVWDWGKDTLDLLELGLPDGHHPGHPVFTPEAGGVLLTVYDLSGFKHGLSACLNRRAHLRHIPDYFKPQESDNLTPAHFVALCPKLSPDGKVLVFAAHQAEFVGHSTCMEMCAVPWPLGSGEMRVVVPRVSRRSDGDLFNGWCGYHAQINSVQFVDQSRTVAFQTLLAGEHAVFVLNLETKERTRIRLGSVDREDGSVVLLGCHVTMSRPTLLVEWSSFRCQPEVWAVELNLKNGAAVAGWTQVVGPNHGGSGGRRCSEQELVQEALVRAELGKISVQTGAEGFVLVNGDIKEDACQPMVVHIHGGPHSMSANAFSNQVALWIGMGLAVCLPNYRGSLGFGSDFSDCLIGKASESVSYTHLRAHETPEHLVCRLLLEKKKKRQKDT